MIRKKMEILRGALKWKFETRKHDEEGVSVTCDPLQEKHTVFSPKGKRIAEHELMRAVCHATLAEGVHPLFSAIIAESGDLLPEKVFQTQIWPVLCVSRRWFADGLFVRQAPDEARAVIVQRLEDVDASFPAGEIDGGVNNFLIAALALAEADTFCDSHRKVSGKLRDMVGVFRRVSPMQPTLKKLQTLNNGLLRTFCPFRVEPVFNEEMAVHVWRVQ